MLGFSPLAAAPLADNAVGAIIGVLSSRRFAVSPESENGGALPFEPKGGRLLRTGNSGHIVRAT
jgi:hypothetical protein